jgi:hypothetical protein
MLDDGSAVLCLWWWWCNGWDGRNRSAHTINVLLHAKSRYTYVSMCCRGYDGICVRDRYVRVLQVSEHVCLQKTNSSHLLTKKNTFTYTRTAALCP